MAVPPLDRDDPLYAQKSEEALVASYTYRKEDPQLIYNLMDTLNSIKLQESSTDLCAKTRCSQAPTTPFKWSMSNYLLSYFFSQETNRINNPGRLRHLLV